MLVKLLRIDQSFSLESGESSFFAVFMLPGGREVLAEMAPDATEAVIKCSMQAQADHNELASPPPPLRNPPPPPIEHPQPAQVSVPVPPVPTPASPVPVNEEELFAHDEKIAWRELPDETLNPRMKSILGSLGIDDVIHLSELKNLVERIVAKMPAPKPPPPQRAPQTPVTNIPNVGQVSWTNGPVIMEKKPIRTVPKDDMGYPIVPGNRDTRDPGEVVGHGDKDEDGIGQL